MSVVTRFDPWRGKLCTCPPKYSFSPYTGCSHSCLYCYASSYVRCFGESRPKDRVERRLLKDLGKLRVDLPISMANSSDPYPPLERSLGLTRRCLKALLTRGLRVMVVTKSSLAVRDLDLIARGNCAVSITITTLDDRLASRMEPGAPKPRERVKAIKVLSSHGVPCIARVDPIVPGLNDDERQVKELVEELVKAGVSHVSSSTYKAKPDSLARMMNAFPEKSKHWLELYGEGGVRVGASRYLKEGLRLEIMKMVGEIVEEHGLTFSTCREGFPHLSTGETCDGTHLIPVRVRCLGLSNSSNAQTPQGL